MRGLVVPMGPELYAVPLFIVTEVVAELRLTRLVTAPSTVVGLINLRGELLPLFDTAALLGLESIPSPACAVIVEVTGAKAAIAVTSTPRVEHLGATVGQGTTPWAVSTHALEDGRMAVLLNVEELLGAGHLGPVRVPR